MAEPEQSSKENEQAEAKDIELCFEPEKENPINNEQGSDKPVPTLECRMFIDVPERGEVGLDGRTEIEFQ